MSDLAEYVENLQRAVAVPGTFASVYPNTSTDDLVATLADGFAEAQLDGFLSDFELNLLTFQTTPDLSLAQVALIILYSGYRMVLNEVRNRQNHVRYEAGVAVFEQDQTASMLNEILRQLKEKKQDVLDQARRGNLYTSGLFMADLALIKATQDYGWRSGLGLAEYEGL